MQRIARHIACWFSCVVFALPALADDGAIDWPTFQGNNARTGASDYPAIKSPTIAWSTQLGIMGYLNCPVIDGDRVFVTSSGDKHNESDPRDGVYCLDMKTGKVLWHYKTAIDACGVTIDGERVYAGDDKGGFHAINRETGKHTWLYGFNASVFGQPLRVGDLILAGGADGIIVAFDPLTGKKQWSFHHNDALRAGMSSDGKQIYAVYLHGRVVCFDLEGAVLWQRDALDAPQGEIETREIYATPTVYKKALYFGFARDTYYDVPAISRLSTEGAFEWVANNPKQPHGGNRIVFGNLRSSFAVHEDLLLYGEPYGNSVVWAHTFDASFTKHYRCGIKMFPHWPSPVIAQNTAYLARHDGGLYAIDAQQKHNQPWMIYLGDHKRARVNGTPDELFQIKSAQWEPAVGKPIYATPAIAKDGTIVIGTGEGWLYCIRELK